MVMVEGLLLGILITSFIRLYLMIGDRRNIN